MGKSGKQDSGSGYFDGYVSFSGVLRSWLIAYGIGAPVLFITQADVTRKLADSGQALTVALLFLSGVFLQVIVALLYKGAMWYLYVGEVEPVKKKTKRYAISDWLSEAYWLELLFDLASIVFFLIATVRVLMILTLR